MKIFVFGSSILSSYWNGAATYYRGIYKYLARRGHDITFAEPDAYGRQQHLDEGDFSYLNSLVYTPGAGIEAMLAVAGTADIVIKHSGIGVDDRLLEARVMDLKKDCVVIFWDVDAPATIRTNASRRPRIPSECWFRNTMQSSRTAAALSFATSIEDLERRHTTASITGSIRRHTIRSRPIRLWHAMLRLWGIGCRIARLASRHCC